MAKRKTRKKRKSKVKLPISVVFSLIIIALVAIGVWCYLHPYEARQQYEIWINQIQGKPTQQSSDQPIPTLDGLKYDNLVYGIPSNADTIIDREGYALGYIEYHEQPAWVIYHLTYEEATNRVASRDDSFREDPEIPSGSATLADYRNSGYDRGHLAPAADMAHSKKTMSESFYMSNMSPQKPAFNRGIWKDLESLVRSFAISERDIYVVTGPILPQTKTITIGPNQVTVPEAYYKVIYDRTPPEKMLGFIIPNDGSDLSLKEFVVSVDDVEAATGLDFFSLIPQPKQEQLESIITINAWNW